MAQSTMTVMPMSREEITRLRSMTFPFFICPWFQPCFHAMIAHSTINNVLSSTFTLSHGWWKFSPRKFLHDSDFVNCGWNLHTSRTVLGVAPMTVLGMALHVVVGCTQKSRLGQVRVCFPALPMEPPPNHNCVRGGAHDCIRGCAACGGRVDTEESVRVGLGLFSCTMDGTSTPPLLVLCLECNMLNSSSRAQLWCVNRLMPQP